MNRARIESHPTLPRADIRTYECGECGDTLIQTFGDEK